MAEAGLGGTTWSGIFADITIFLPYGWTPCCHHIHTEVRNRERMNSELAARVNPNRKLPNILRPSWPPMLSCKKTSYHIVCVFVFMCLWSYRFWGGFPVETSSPLSVWRALASSTFYSKMLAETDGESISFIVRVSYHFLPHHPLVSFIVVHSYSSSPFALFFFFGVSSKMDTAQHTLAHTLALGWCRGGIWSSYNPARVRNWSDPYFLIVPQLLKWFQTCAVIRSFPC